MRRLHPVVITEIGRIFTSKDASLATIALTNTSFPQAYNAPYLRIDLAILWLSDGDLRKLYTLISQAETDWRDILVSAGLASDDWQEIIAELGIYISIHNTE